MLLMVGLREMTVKALYGEFGSFEHFVLLVYPQHIQTNHFCLF